MGIKIQPVQHEKLVLLQQISRETFSDTFAASNTEKDLQDYLKQAYNLEQLHSELDNPQSFFYFIQLDGKEAGYLKLNTGHAQSEVMPATAMEVERIYVRSAFKRQGLGTLLINFAIDEAKRQQKSAIWLGVWEKNAAALAFYKELGFTEVGSHSFFMGEDEQRDLIVEKKLKEDEE